MAVYARVSTSKQVGGKFDSCDHQIERAKEIIASKSEIGWFCAEEFRDEGKSGKDLLRPGMQRLLDGVRQGRFRIVLALHVDRVSRNLLDFKTLSAVCEENGCILTCGDTDQSTAQGQLLMDMNSAVAEYERRNIRAKSLAKSEARAKKGLWCGGNVPFGYEYDRVEKELAPDPERAETLARVYRDLVAGTSLKEISKALNESGIRTPVRIQRGKDGSKRTVGGRRIRSDWLRDLIRNPIYMGKIAYRGSLHEGQHQALVDPDTWAAANCVLDRTEIEPKLRIERDKDFNLLKGILRCGHCGTKLVPHASGKHDDRGRPIRYYVCGLHLKERAAAECPLGSLSGEAMESAVLRILTRLSEREDLVRKIVGASDVDKVTWQAELQERVQILKARLEAVLRKKRNLHESITELGVELARELRPKLEKLHQEERELRAEVGESMSQIRELGRPALVAEEVIAALSQLPDLLRDQPECEQRELVRELIREVVCRSGNEMTGDSKRTVRLTLHLGIPLEVNGASGSKGVSGPLRHEEIYVAVKGPRGKVEYLSPEAAKIAAEKRNRRKPARKAPTRHPLHRVAGWHKLLTDQTFSSVRSLARHLGISHVMLSRNLQCMRLIQPVLNHVLGLRDPERIRAISLRQLEALSKKAKKEQLKQLEAWQSPIDQIEQVDRFGHGT